MTAEQDQAAWAIDLETILPQEAPLRGAVIASKLFAFAELVAAKVFFLNIFWESTVSERILCMFPSITYLFGLTNVVALYVI